MPRRLTIAGWMGLIAIAATGLAALRQPNRFAANAMFSLAVGAITCSVLIAIVANGSTKVFNRGFAIAGSIYLILSLGPGFEYGIGHDLVTTSLIDFAHEMITTSNVKRVWYYTGGAAQTNVLVGPPQEYWFSNREMPVFLLGAEVRPSPQARPFFRVAHCLFSVLAGLGGGLICLGVSRQVTVRDRHTSPPADTP